VERGGEVVEGGVNVGEERERAGRKDMGPSFRFPLCKRMSDIAMQYLE
jgi:hypothetical protein